MPATPSIIENVPVILKINVPSIKVQKAFKVSSGDTIWSIGRLVSEKVMQDIKDVFNFGLFLHGKEGKKGKFLDDRNTVGSYHLDGSVSCASVDIWQLCSSHCTTSYNT